MFSTTTLSQRQAQLVCEGFPFSLAVTAVALNADAGRSITVGDFGAATAEFSHGPLEFRLDDRIRVCEAYLPITQTTVTNQIRKQFDLAFPHCLATKDRKAPGNCDSLPCLQLSQ